MKVIGSPLYQWEVGRQIEIIPIRDMRVNSVHFANYGDAEALVVKPKEENGILVADIPNILLQNGSKLIAHSVNVSTDCVETLRECVFSVRQRAKPSDYVYTETEVWNYKALEARMQAMEENLDEQVASSIEKYLEENPIDGVKFETDSTLTLKDGVLSVNTTDQMEQDNTLPITSAGVFATVGNIEALLKTI
jgi:hypothetical protein